MKATIGVKPIQHKIFTVPPFKDKQFTERERELIIDAARFAYISALHDMLNLSTEALSEVCFTTGQLGLDKPVDGFTKTTDGFIKDR